MIEVSDDQSIAGMQLLHEVLNISAGPSTGTNLFGALKIAHEMYQNNESGSVVTLICDLADRYQDTYYDSSWLAQQGIDPHEVKQSLRSFLGHSTAYEIR